MSNTKQTRRLFNETANEVNYLFMNSKKNKASIDRVIQLITHEMGMTKAEFSRQLGESTQALNNWINREKIPGEKLAKVSEVIGQSIEWILTGNDADFTEFKKANNADDNVPVQPFHSMQDSIGKAQIETQLESNKPLRFQKDWLNEKGLNNEHCAIVIVQDDSMAPVINDGSVILINRADKTIMDGKYYALNYGNDNVRVKMLYKQIDGSVLIKSINPAYQDEILKPDEMELLSVIGRVVWVGNEL